MSWPPIAILPFFFRKITSESLAGHEASLNTDYISQLPLVLDVAIQPRSGQWDARSIMSNFLQVALKGWNASSKARAPAATSGHEVASDFGAIPKIASWGDNKTEGLSPCRLCTYSEHIDYVLTYHTYRDLYVISVFAIFSFLPLAPQPTEMAPS